MHVAVKEVTCMASLVSHKIVVIHRFVEMD